MFRGLLLSFRKDFITYKAIFRGLFVFDEFLFFNFSYNIKVRAVPIRVELSKEKKTY